MHRVMVVEDDPDMRRLVSITLSIDPDLEVCGDASSAAEAVTQARSLAPDVVIMDYFIEGEVMGIDAANMIKSAAPDVRVLLFTSHDLATDAERTSGIDGYVQKDNLIELVPAIQRLVGQAPPQ